MYKFMIEGKTPWIGDITISGAKNTALPLIFATILTDQPVTLTNVPQLRDVTTALKLLEAIGKTCSQEGNVVNISGKVTSPKPPYDMVRTMRASVMLLGPLVAKLGEADVGLPGGCAIGARPVNYHVNGLRQLSAFAEDNGECVLAKADKLIGNVIKMENVSVTGTENMVMAAVFAEGTTVIENAAREPEVSDLCSFLRLLGADIEGDGTTTITIKGVEKLNGGTYPVQPDRIETGTYLVGAAVSGGHIRCLNTDYHLLQAVVDKLVEAGAKVTLTEDTIELDMQGRELRPVNISTEPFPGFPTDMQAPFTVLNAVAKGTATIKENIFENRFMHVPELVRMGAKITQDGDLATCYDTDTLKGATVMATDLRASASLVIAGTIAEGTTIVDQVDYIDRGYEYIEKKLNALGCKITRIK